MRQADEEKLLHRRKTSRANRAPADATKEEQEMRGKVRQNYIGHLELGNDLTPQNFFKQERMSPDDNFSALLTMYPVFEKMYESYKKVYPTVKKNEPVLATLQ